MKASPVAAASLLFALLGSLLPAARTAAQERTVTLWHAYGDAEAAGLVEAVRAFRRAHPDVRVDVVHNAFGAYAPKLESAIPTGHGPDVFIDAHERLVTYQVAGLVAPLGAMGLEQRLDFTTEHIEALSVDGQTYGLPLAVKCAALYLAQDFAPEAPATLEDLEALRDTLPDDVWPLVFEAENSYYVAALLGAYGGSIIDRNGAWAFEGPPAERALALLIRMTRSHVIPEEPNGDLVKQIFSSGQAAAAISGPWLAPDLPESLRWRVVPLPAVRDADGARMRPFVTVEGAILAANARNRPDAIALIRFLAGSDGSLLRARLGRQVVASRTAWEDPALRDDAFLRTFRDAAAAGRLMPTHPHMRAAFEPATRAIRKTLRGDMAPGLALTEARRRFEDMTRPPPPPRNPTAALLIIGLLFLVVAALSVRKARSTEFRARLRASVPAYRYVAHAFLAVTLLVIAPLLVGAATSFFAGRGMDMHYAGIANYAEILTNRGGSLLENGSFWLVLLVTVLWTVANLTLHVVIGVALALLLHRPTLRLKGTYRVLLILPWAVPNYVTALSWKGMFHRQFGAVNAILEGVGAEPVSWFGQFATAFTANLATNVWLGFPFMMVVTLGALATIPKDLYEAAAVDGASAWQRFRLITVPMLKPMLAPAVVMGSVWTFNMFNVIFLVSGGEPDGSTEILVSEAYRWAFTRSAQYGYAAAYAVLIFGILLLATRTIGQRIEGMGAAR